LRRRRRAAVAAALAATMTACAPHHAATSPDVPRKRAVAAAVHAPPWSAAEVRALQTALRGVFGETGGPTSGIAVVDADARPLYGSNDRTPLVPASTFKLLCGISALDVLGPQFRFATELRAADAPDGSAIHGDVDLVGSGDPTLTRDDLRAAAGVLARAGIDRVDGALVADASAFAGPEVNPAWDPDDLQYGYAAGASALQIDEGTVEFHLVPGAVGSPASIEVRPPGGGVVVRGGVLTGYTTDLAIDRDPARNAFVFSGRIAAGAEQSFWRPLIELPRYAATVLASRLDERGIALAGGVRLGVAPLGGVTLWLHRSAPLAAIVHDMWLTSDNQHAEQLLRVLGAQRGTGTVASGARVEGAVLARDGVPAPGLRVVDGSGLAASDRVAPETLAVLLARAAAAPDGATIVRDLPRVGIEGTVRYRTLTDAAGRVRAKSGHISHVNALAGYVQTRRHGRIAFAFLVNGRGANAEAIDDAIDRALDILARS
jgi:D-alanyl-D-alanine carboxypeptidase/D-alanyl-D-alanine-endopeptidase (penicillin-binding protein 4)